MKKLLIIFGFILAAIQLQAQDTEYKLNMRTGKFDLVRTAAYIAANSGGSAGPDSTTAAYGLHETANALRVDSTLLMTIIKFNQRSRDTSNVLRTAINLKLAKTDTGTMLNTYARKLSPTLTGTPLAPTAVTGTNTTQLATTAFVQAQSAHQIADSLANLTISMNTVAYADTIVVVSHDSLHIVIKYRNLAVVATNDGLTTGLLAKGDKNITVSSASANNIVCLPTTAAADIGTVITGQVGANGFELRTIDAQKASVYINNVTTSVEAAIAANTNFEIRCIDATHWILKCWNALGETLTAIIPDAI